MDSENGHGMVAARWEPQGRDRDGAGARGGRPEMGCAEAAGPGPAPQRGLPAAGLSQRPS